MDVIPYKFKKFSKIVSKLCILGGIPAYNSKFSNKIFTNIQHLFLLVAKENTTYGYRKFVESLYDSKIPRYISLRRIPHFTTLQKFAQRLEAYVVKAHSLVPLFITSLALLFLLIGYVSYKKSKEGLFPKPELLAVNMSFSFIIGFLFIKQILLIGFLIVQILTFSIVEIEHIIHTGARK